jgi:hypothetical protein
MHSQSFLVGQVVQVHLMVPVDLVRQLPHHHRRLCHHRMIRCMSLQLQGGQVHPCHPFHQAGQGLVLLRVPLVLIILVASF